jgi:flagellar motor switch protein FliG
LAVQTNDAGGDGDFQPLDAIEPERLARVLSGASRTTVAIALARLSERRRSAVVALLPTEKAEGARRALAALERTTDAARRLEDALFNGALDDE